MGLEIDGVSGIIKNTTSDGDITIKGNDGGSEVTAMSFDMSAAGIATLTAGLKLTGTTPTLTIGDAGAEDTKIVFDGNQVDFVMGVDDSADEFRLGVGTALGSTRVIEIDSDGVTVFQKSVTFAGSTPTVTIGDAGAEDAKIVFDGNAQDYHIGLDDSADSLILGLGSALGTTEMITLSTSAVVVNEDSQDLDFRVESNDYTHAFHVNAGNNSVSTGAIERNFGLFTVTSGDSNCGNADSEGDEFVIEVQNSINGGMSILTDQARSGNIFFGDQGANKVGIISYDHSSNSMKFGTGGTILHRFTSGGVFSANESAPDAGIHGLTLNQGAGDGNILTFKSSDVAHGITGAAETDTYFNIAKTAANEGGVRITAFSETNSDVLRMFGIGTGEQDGESTSHGATVEIIGGKKNSTGIADLSGDGNLFACRQYSGTTALIIKGDGEIFSNQSATVGTFDAYEDAQLVRAYDLNHMQGVINSKFDKFVQYNKDDLQKAKLIGTDDDNNATSMVNITGMQRLHNGAIWQQYEKHQKLAEAVYEMAKETLGADKADAILKKHDIKLLN